MKIIVFGSFNIDKVYSLPYLPERGETLYCQKYEVHVGGKGVNQALAFRKAGAEVIAAGRVGEDGDYLTDWLKANDVNASFVEHGEGYTGHTIIEVAPDGQNQMILFGGANLGITPEYCDRLLDAHRDAELVMMQYETSCVEYMLEASKKAGIPTALNPSPYTEKLKELPYDMVDYLILNESEGKNITGKNDPSDVIDSLLKLCGGKVILTLGDKGSIYSSGDISVSVPAFSVNAVDTTGAGDTFTGYCLYELLCGASPETALKKASAASAIEVTRPGAAETIPSADEVDEFLSRREK
ncbi:MAG: ribokinase [Clostridiales bacterium]|nr:ribokinase [Clostridiales bacterium]